MTLQDDLNRMLADALTPAMAEEYRVEYDTSPLVDGPAITVHKHAGFLQLSVDQLLDAGLITEDQARAQGRTPPPPPTRRDRLRWRWQAWRERTGRKVGGWIAGVDLSERDDDW